MVIQILLKINNFGFEFSEFDMYVLRIYNNKNLKFLKFDDNLK